MTLRQVLEMGSGFAGSITSIHTMNVQFEETKSNFGTGIITLGLVLSINAGLSTFVPALLIGGILDAVVGAFIIIHESCMNKHRFFNKRPSLIDFCSKVLTVFTSPFISILFALDQCLNYVGYFIHALADLILLDFSSAFKNVEKAGDAFAKIFFNLAAAIFNPIINLVDVIGSLFVSNENEHPGVDQVPLPF